MRGWKAAGQTVLEASMSDERLTELLAGVGRRYGYRKVKARFRPLDGAKVRWKRSGGSVRLEVSDFLAAATDQEMCEIADAVFHSIAVKGWEPANSEELVSLGRGDVPHQRWKGADRPRWLRTSEGVGREAAREGEPRGRRDNR
ncbi:MAG: hypothetical protein E7Z68_02270 [Thermoplasmata archaeon]|jgi:hypothetical protein|nr:hypothetical protein [Thermoplasmata archaeon]